LTLTIPVAERAKPRKVAVDTPGQQTAIDASNQDSTVDTTSH
jgi:hypothetical protein